MVLATRRHPAALRDDVTTPAGCTIGGLLMLEDGRIRSVLARAVEEATRIASHLGATPGKH
jgi:pyrroline-5-carboxylate reductase